jgi:hypothetical protein
VQDELERSTLGGGLRIGADCGGNGVVVIDEAYGPVPVKIS